jgi:signal transduction histidine kinase
LLDSVCAKHGHVRPTERYSTLLDETEQLRAITLLQQRAQALEAEIEERKRLEQALRERNDALQNAVAARDEFLSVATHELRTPITGLRLTAQSLAIVMKRGRAVTPERLESVLDTVEKQTDKLTQLVSRLLDHAQLGANKLNVDPVRLDLASLVRSVLAERLQDSERPIVYDGPEHFDAFVDPLRFEQVITNLVDNAVKFSPHGGTITVALVEDGPAKVKLSITDHGVGIPEDQRDQVFQRFHQAHRRSHLSGLGLGLYITHEVVALHGGEIRIEQPEHDGTRFVIVLPVSAEAGSASTAA